MDMMWKPSESLVDGSHIHQFIKQADVGPQVVDFSSLHQFSIQEPASFWSSVWDYCGIKGHKGDRVFDPGQDMLSAQFFPDARLNFAENLLARSDDSEAIVAWGEGKEVRRLTWSELNRQVLSFASWLRAQGIQPGDRVVAVMPNIPETVIAMLGASAIGAIFSSASPDFGEQGLLDRFEQIEPRLLIAADGYRYNGKPIDVRDKISKVAARIASLERVVTVSYMDLDHPKGTQRWDDAVKEEPGSAFVFEQFPFDHPLYILFSSGTTGKPKCIVHGAGGTLLQHMKEHQLQSNVWPGDRFFYFTTCGWMMLNWLVSALASKATLLLYDGSPFYPNGNVLFDYAQNEKATFFGTSAKFIDAVKKAGLRPKDTHDLSSLRTIASTGSPLVAESFDFVYDAIKTDLHLASISGGTDIISCFIGANPTGPVYRGELQAPGLGMAVEIWDEEGHPVTGERGELVCTKPFPSMPLGFWNDPQKEKYAASYFAKYPDVWCHGDFALKTENGGYVILGRSDATLNPGGVRIGTAEIYRQVEQLDDVLESIVIGQNWEGDVRVILFVVLQDGLTLSDDLIAEIKSRIRAGATPRHVPAKVIQVADIPRTKSGKITELAVRDVIHGREIKNTEALANPDALELFKDLPELMAPVSA